jgi:chemotaxis protein MotB
LRKAQSPWNTLNILSASFLFVLILFIISFSVYQQALGQGSDRPVSTNLQTGAPALPGQEPDDLLDDLNARLASLEARETELREKEQALKEQEEFLKEQEASLKDLVDVRTNIIKQLVDKFEESNLVLEIDNQTGAIRFSDGIFFDSNRDVIKANGAEYLKQFIPAYFSILLSESNRDYIAEIIIEGHTDDMGSYIYNLDLSQRRAFAVARYILESNIPNFTYQDMIHNYLTANGKSFSQPIMTGGIIDKQKSRRVEFKFRLKDEETIKEMQHIFEGTAP